MVTEALPGTSAVDPLWLARPQQAVEAIAVGLRQAHDALPAADCPFTGTWTLGVEAPGASDAVGVHGDPCVRTPCLMPPAASLAWDRITFYRRLWDPA